MRTTLILLFTVVFCSVAGTGHSQNARVTLNKRNVTLRETLNDIENQTDYLFIYSNEIDVNEKISIKAKQESVANVLTHLLQRKNIDYSMEGNHIILSAQQEGVKETVETIMAKQQQGVTVKGVVVDISGEPIIGANIIEKGTANGTVTDFDGNFTLVVSNNAILQVSYIGYLTQEVKASGAAIRVVLQEDMKALEEVVVVGYGVQKKANLTGAVSNIDSDVLENRTSANVTNLLTGQVSGVTIVQSSSQPGMDAGMLRVRGVGTLGNSEAMVLIDGMESSISNVNPNDIESMTILKDAAASSIYGVRAANGVILITTKKGSEGKAKINYSGHVGWQSPTSLPKFLGSYDYATLLNEAYTNDNLNAPYSEAELQKFKNQSDPINYPNTDWMKELISRNGAFHNHHLSISGGSKTNRYNVSLGYVDQQGLLENTSYNRMNFRTSLDTELNDRLNVSYNLSVIRGVRLEPAASVRTVMAYSLRESPITTLKYGENKYGLFMNEHNSVALAKNSGTDKTVDTNVQGNIDLSYKITDWLSFKGNAGAIGRLADNKRFTKSMNFYNSDSDTPSRTTRNEVRDTDTKFMEYNLQAFLDFNHSFGKNTLSGLAGVSQIYNQSKFLRALRKDLPLSNSLGEINAGDVTTQETSGYMNEYALRSAFGRINYGFDDRYLFEFNLRYDGSSRFPKDNRFGFFPSVSAAWRLSEEGFFNSEKINSLKLRGSWGLLGNQEIGNYAFYNTYIFDQDYVYNGAISPGISINNTIANTRITWEKSSQVDIGVDLISFNGMFNATADFFIKDTKDILLQLPIPSMIGANPPMQNAGRVKNTGVELEMSHNNKINDFRYSVAFNISYIHNEITDLKGGETPGRSVGDPIYNIYGYKADGLFNSQAEIDSSPKQTWGAVPGDVKYLDLNDDGVVDEQDRKSLGSYFPKINYGLNVNLEYKDFDLAILGQGTGMVYGVMRHELGKAFYNGAKVSEVHLNRWTPENTNASYPRLSMQNSNRNWHSSSYWMQNASYFRIRNLQFGYTLPQSFANKLMIDNLRVYLNVDNLLTITGFKGVDPESNYDLQNFQSGSYYPITRNYSFGLNISF